MYEYYFTFVFCEFLNVIMLVIVFCTTGPPIFLYSIQNQSQSYIKRAESQFGQNDTGQSVSRWPNCLSGQTVSVNLAKVSWTVLFWPNCDSAIKITLVQIISNSFKLWLKRLFQSRVSIKLDDRIRTELADTFLMGNFKHYGPEVLNELRNSGTKEWDEGLGKEEGMFNVMCNAFPTVVSSHQVSPPVPCFRSLLPGPPCWALKCPYLKMNFSKN